MWANLAKLAKSVLMWVGFDTIMRDLPRGVQYMLESLSNPGLNLGSMTQSSALQAFQKIADKGNVSGPEQFASYAIASLGRVISCMVSNVEPYATNNVYLHEIASSCAHNPLIGTSERIRYASVIVGGDCDLSSAEMADLFVRYCQENNIPLMTKGNKLNDQIASIVANFNAMETSSVLAYQMIKRALVCYEVINADTPLSSVTLNVNERAKESTNVIKEQGAAAQQSQQADSSEKGSMSMFQFMNYDPSRNVMEDVTEEESIPNVFDLINRTVRDEEEEEATDIDDEDIDDDEDGLGETRLF